MAELQDNLYHYPVIVIAYNSPSLGANIYNLYFFFDK